MSKASAEAQERGDRVLGLSARDEDRAPTPVGPGPRPGVVHALGLRFESREQRLRSPDIARTREGLDRVRKDGERSRLSDADRFEERDGLGERDAGIRGIPLRERDQPLHHERPHNRGSLPSWPSPAQEEIRRASRICRVAEPRGDERTRIVQPSRREARVLRRLDPEARQLAGLDEVAGGALQEREIVETVRSRQLHPFAGGGLEGIIEAFPSPREIAGPEPELPRKGARSFAGALSPKGKLQVHRFVEQIRTRVTDERLHHRER